MGNIATSQFYGIRFTPEFGLLSLWSFACFFQVIWFRHTVQKHADWWIATVPLVVN